MRMITKTDISITFFHKEYQDLSPLEMKRVNEEYAAHLELRKKAASLWGEIKDE